MPFAIVYPIVYVVRGAAITHRSHPIYKAPISSGHPSIEILVLGAFCQISFEFEAVRNPSNRPKSNFSTANHMASIITSKLPLPPLFVSERRPLLTPPQQFSVSAIGGGKGRVAVIAKAIGESSESSTSLSIVKSVQSIWDKSEDRIALIGLGFAGVVAFWASINLITAIDKLPLIPSALEFIGILFSSGRAGSNHQQVDSRYLGPVIRRQQEANVTDSLIVQIPYCLSLHDIVVASASYCCSNEILALYAVGTYQLCVMYHAKD
ncbi:hypothetical protein RJ639_040896 [Escallonia herrerae]|uniref:Cyanobacterial aminoacyl-tRNA synthetase CAAD domain-containing protein n=1 Tax=Escallonia herrerae TaxID=1293975 RepID=A0AA88WIS6_9ASTE|nr:hypothetical protein RJ639_040896 [Escallonia herrerae]